MGLPWNFEAFRRYINYETMQQTAAVISLYEGEDLETYNPKMEEMLEELKLRTGRSWLPERSPYLENIEFNPEGNFYRNKGRLLTSLYIIYPKQLLDKSIIKLTPFGIALGNGHISKKEYYEFILTRYLYPHPAYDDNWQQWNSQNKRLKPFIFILQILVGLYKTGRKSGFVTSAELAMLAYPSSDHHSTTIRSICEKILSERDHPSASREYSDQVDRKINDMLGFLCISGFTFYDGSKIRLNLLGVHPGECTHFWEKRSPRGDIEANRLRYIENLILDSLREVQP